MKTDTYANLTTFGKKLLNTTGFEEGLPLIAEYACNIIKTQRCSIFVYDKTTGELWTTLADGIDRIVIDEYKGIVGYALRKKECVIENNVEENPYFLSDVDKGSGFTTQNLIVAPIFDERKKIIGALELLNKESAFTEDDKKFMIFFSSFISSFIDLARR